MWEQNQHSVFNTAKWEWASFLVPAGKIEVSGVMLWWGQDLNKVLSVLLVGKSDFLHQITLGKKSTSLQVKCPTLLQVRLEIWPFGYHQKQSPCCSVSECSQALCCLRDGKNGTAHKIFWLPEPVPTHLHAVLFFAHNTAAFLAYHLGTGSCGWEPETQALSQPVPLTRVWDPQKGKWGQGECGVDTYNCQWLQPLYFTVTCCRALSPPENMLNGQEGNNMFIFSLTKFSQNAGSMKAFWVAGFIISLRQLYQTQHSTLILNLRSKLSQRKPTPKLVELFQPWNAGFETCALNCQASVCSLGTWQACICRKWN